MISSSSMINVFQLNYEPRLKGWYDLRSELSDKDTQTKCVEVDKWWQQAPMVNHYLHPLDTKSWPGPWELLVENNYCNLARGLGMCYTLALLGIESIDFLLGKDDNDEEVALVVVDRAKYVLNYWPDSVISTSLTDFKITNQIDLTQVIKKIK